MITIDALKKNWDEVQVDIDAAAKISGRTAAEVQVIAVTKTWPAELIRNAFSLGIRSFGENYVQEVLPKVEALSDLPLEWHFIGHLQSNKVRQIAGKFKLIHSLDRLSVAEEISKRSTEDQDVLIEVNFANEATKSGIDPSRVPQLLQSIQSLPRLRPRGIMTMPPLSYSESELEVFYSRVVTQLERWKSEVATAKDFNELSMGTSHDYKVAIANGATMVRIGSVLFGERN